MNHSVSIRHLICSVMAGRIGLPRVRIVCMTHQRSCSAVYSEAGEVDLTPSKHSHNRITQPVKMTSEEIIQTQADTLVDEHRRHDRKKVPKSNSWNDSSILQKRRKQPFTPKKFISDRTVTKVSPKGEILYGKFPVLMALQAKRRLCHKLYVKSSMFEGGSSQSGILQNLTAYGQQEGIEVEPVTANFLNHLVLDPVQGLRQHQGICADVSKMKHIDLDNEQSRSCLQQNYNRCQLWLLIQSVQDPNNFGAILRTAYYLGVDKIIAHNSCKLTPAVSKVSAGALELMDVHRIAELPNFLQDCRNIGWQILGTGGMKTDKTSCKPAGLKNITINKNTIVVLGNEGEGLSEQINSLCDELVVVSRAAERTGGASLLLDSLNVSVATGIILHDLIEKRNNQT